MKNETIAEETRRGFAYIRNKVKAGEDNILLHFSGTMNKRTRMYKEVQRYESDAKIDRELGVISQSEYDVEIKAIRLLEQSLANFHLF